jgi:hypothetical protein
MKPRKSIPLTDATGLKSRKRRHPTKRHLPSERQSSNRGLEKSCEQKVRMNGFMDRVVSGRIFKEFVAFIRGEDVVFGSPHFRQRMNDEEHGNIAGSQSTEMLGRLIRTNPSRELDGENIPVQGCTSSSQPELVLTSFTHPSSLVSNHLRLQSSIMAPWQSPEPPPVTAQYLKLYTFSGQGGKLSSALELTDTLVWQLNFIFRCQNSISTYTQKIETVESRRMKMVAVIDGYHELIQASEDAEEQATLLEDLGDAQQMEQDAGQERLDLEARLQHWTEEMQLPSFQMFLDLNRVMAENNLLEAFPDSSDIGQPTTDEMDINDDEPVYNARSSPTPSEAARRDWADAQDAARELVNEREYQLQDAADKVENFGDYYEAQLRTFQEWKAEGRIDSTKTDFDVSLLQQAQVATGALIQAEQELEAAREHARDLGVVSSDFGQESGFLDYADDGYRESMEADIAAHVDRGRIEKWMDEENGNQDQSPDCDSWDSESVDFGDSISVVAEGKGRKRIDRWRSMCELTKLEIQVETEEETY